MSERRNFNSRERVKLFLSSDGKCSICGVDIVEGWHADHILPFSMGGKTHILNGQALCPKCNLSKGAKVMSGLWDWQKEAYREWISATQDNFLCVACPGSGKTIFALACVKSFMEKNRNCTVIIVCPTSPLKQQWADVALNEFNINLKADFDNRAGTYPKDFSGVCTTYQSVASEPLIYKRMCKGNSIIILDEIHHAGEQLTWGDSIETAFGDASKRLMLSGTPFRSDNIKIPFVTYIDNVCKSDFVYKYELAQVDQCCRGIDFVRFDGNMEWVDNKFEVIKSSFTDDLSEEKANERLKTALEPNMGWLNEVLAAADKQLSFLRSTSHPNAGGLVLARDNVSSHVTNIANILLGINNPQDIAIATSDQIDAGDTIKDFRTNNKKWLVVVKMVSEGVDIPRLRVGVHATNITTEMFFRQAVGRFTRYQRELDSLQRSCYYIPMDSRILEIADRVQEEVIHHIYDDIGDEIANIDYNREDTNIERSSKYYKALNSEANFHSVKTDLGDIYTSEMFKEAEEVCKRLGNPNLNEIDLVKIISIYKDVKGNVGVSSLFNFGNVTNQERSNIMNKADREEVLRRRIATGVGVLVKDNPLFSYDDFHIALNKKIGVRSASRISCVTEQQLIDKLELVRKSTTSD